MKEGKEWSKRETNIGLGDGEKGREEEGRETGVYSRVVEGRCKRGKVRGR